MQKKLKQYRKSNGLSKKEMAKKLGLSVDEYKKIEDSSSPQINKELRDKIIDLISKKSPGLLPSNLLFEQLKPFNNLYDKINKSYAFDNPLGEKLKALENPLGSSLAISQAMSHFEGFNTALEFSKSLNSMGSNNEIWKHITNPITEISGLSSIIDSQMDTYKIFSKDAFKDFSGPSEEINKLLNNIKTSIPDYGFIQETVLNNKALFNDYLKFSSELTSSLIDANNIQTSFFADNFYKPIQELSAFDIISGATFSSMIEEFNEVDNDIFEEIKNDTEFSGKLLKFYEELEEVVDLDSDGEVEFTKLENLYLRMVVWIQETFEYSVNEAEILTRVLVKYLPTIYFLIGLTMSSYDSRNNLNQHSTTQELINIQSDKRFMEAIEETPLFNRPSNGSKRECSVNSGQDVEVLEKKRLWMRIAFEDMYNNEPKTGWVRIVDFVIIKR